MSVRPLTAPPAAGAALSLTRVCARVSVHVCHATASGPRAQRHLWRLAAPSRRASGGVARAGRRPARVAPAFAFPGGNNEPADPLCNSAEASWAGRGRAWQAAAGRRGAALAP
ncbi:MAG: hypothetical protein J3K34DRAFT_379775 [Monoraphidium minutum]|nr:MAG: hypothetical protein J3K34DRAFT_379775 [Monoraphidium minutum]